MGDSTLKRAVSVLVQVADAVAHAHREQFVHRDLKPENILFNSGGSAFVTDFGLAFHETDRWTQTKQRCGTLAYMAPEQIRYTANRIDGRADIWALGVILYEMLVGQHPFHGENASQLCDDILHRDMPMARQIDHTIPESVQLVCLRCCSKAPQERFASAFDVAEALRGAMVLDSPLDDSESPQPFARLRVFHGPEVGREFAICAGEKLVIGRGQASDTRIKDASISRVHCELQCDGESVRVIDRGSSSGTFVDGRKVSEAQLRSGSVLNVGNSRIRFVTEAVIDARTVPPNTT